MEWALFFYMGYISIIKLILIGKKIDVIRNNIFFGYFYVYYQI